MRRAGLWLLLAGCDEGRPGCPEGQVFDHDAWACLDYNPGEPVAADVWRPEPGTTWQWQLTGLIDTTLPVQMYDVDLDDVTNDELTALSDRVVICYLSAGSWEAFRDDVGEIPEDAIGARLEGWRDERWFDVTHPAVRDLLTRRLDRAVNRGCDGVEPDNVDGYANLPGFPMNATEQLAFNRFIADEAHARGLSVGLKNDLDQLAELEPWFDWALNEQCHEYEECGVYTPFRAAGKAVFHVEYVSRWEDAAAEAERVCAHPGFSTLVKLLDLGPEFQNCG